LDKEWGLTTAEVWVGEKADKWDTDSELGLDAKLASEMVS
jgi:hypothetical protein